MSSSSKVLAFVHDPGSFSMLLPVIIDLNKKLGAQFTIHGSSFVSKRLNAIKIPVTELGDQTQLATEAIIQKVNPNVIITGTSWGSPVEQNARNRAHYKKIKSVVVVDYWANYKERWKGMDHSIAKLTDQICAVDSNMKQEMKAAGFPDEQIHVTGHPYLELLSHVPYKPKNNVIKNVLFLSEPRISEDKKLVLKLVTGILEKIAKANQAPVELFIKSHPKENISPLEEWKAFETKNVLIKPVLQETMTPESYKDFDVVMGYQTMGLVEAAVMGIPAVAFPLGLKSQAVLLAFQTNGVTIIQGAQDLLDLDSKLIQRLKEPVLTHDLKYSGAKDFVLKRILE